MQRQCCRKREKSHAAQCNLRLISILWSWSLDTNKGSVFAVQGSVFALPVLPYRKTYYKLQMRSCAFPACLVGRARSLHDQWAKCSQSSVQTPFPELQPLPGWTVQYLANNYKDKLLTFFQNRRASAFEPNCNQRHQPKTG